MSWMVKLFGKVGGGVFIGRRFSINDVVKKLLREISSKTYQLQFFSYHYEYALS